ncbi:hypothetical protein [Geoglobus acetivorans]|uniref:Uncharacterized protein n=1 Tax=Geoglobus acetivorans TaxID=565033 RepID=A0ABZ3H2P8_GEOAI|nr:hypothetical protein [Geoglobus acetivorans]
MSRRGILDRYLRVKREKGLMAALDQLDRDKDLLSRSTYYWVRKKLAGDGPAIYQIDEETAVEVHSKEIAEALDVVSATTVKAILDHLKELEKDGVDIKLHLRENYWIYELIENMALNGALAAFEYLGYVKYVSMEEINQLNE